MKIVILMGSPNRNGSTGILVENFVRGAQEAGQEKCRPGYEDGIIDVPVLQDQNKTCTAAGT